MAHAVFHLSDEFITEDLDYYFSGERDKNNQIRPDDNIASLTPHSSHLSHTLGEGQVANFFYPTQPNLLDRIYIGISIPLFANNWGASFLLQLLKVLTPDGAIILPVYPEGQAQEKGYWSRSFLENIFLSRQRWTGFSNVRAENDGVMSMRVGRKWPDPISSTVEWFYKQRSNILLEKLSENDGQGNIKSIHTSIIEKVWENYARSAVLERIILDFYGAKTPVNTHCICDDYGLLITDLLLSPYINVVSGVTHTFTTVNDSTTLNFNSYFSPYTGEQHKIKKAELPDLEINQLLDVICLLNSCVGADISLRSSLFNTAWSKLKPMGLLIVYEDLVGNNALTASELNNELEKFGTVQKYSSIVASKIQEGIDISHYSSIQESRLIEEKHSENKIFRVIQKTT